MSPQSRIVYGEEYGFRPRRGLKPLNDVWRAEATRMARGPKRAPRYWSQEWMDLGALSCCDPKQAPSNLSFFQYQYNGNLQSMSG